MSAVADSRLIARRTPASPYKLPLLVLLVDRTSRDQAGTCAAALNWVPGSTSPASTVCSPARLPMSFQLAGMRAGIPTGILSPCCAA
jgi:hypothetical protein